MITLLIIAGMVYLCLGAVWAGKLSFYLEKKFDTCAPVWHFCFLILWMVLPLTIYADLACRGIVK